MAAAADVHCATRRLKSALGTILRLCVSLPNGRYRPSGRSENVHCIESHYADNRRMLPSTTYVDVKSTLFIQSDRITKSSNEMRNFSSFLPEGIPFCRASQRELDNTIYDPILITPFHHEFAWVHAVLRDDVEQQLKVEVTKPLA